MLAFVLLIFLACFGMFVLLRFSFLCKQVTLYELRIRDLISDVCSSVLVVSLISGKASIGTLKRRQSSASLAPLARFISEVREAVVMSVTQRPVRRSRKIERASCREGVCQYV